MQYNRFLNQINDVKKKVIFMKSKILLIFLLLAVVGIAGCASYTQDSAGTSGDTKILAKTPSETSDETPADKTPQETPTATTHDITITAEGFSPKILTIQTGDTVRWTNTINHGVWPATDIHPTHTVYPGSGITKCGSGENIFDSCRGLNNGDTYSFTFDEKGTWNYHDHLRSSTTGTIVVE